MADTEKKIMDRVFKTLSVVTKRMKYAAGLGETYGGDRDLYQALGYKIELLYEDYYRKFKRADIAKTIISKPAAATWGNPPVLINTEKPEENKIVDDDPESLKNQWENLVEEYNIYSQLYRLDKLLGLGRYAILFFGFDDNDDFTKPLNTDNDPELLYIHPYGEDHVKIIRFETDKQNKRYGLPLLYQLQVKDPMTDTRTTTLTVHHSRVLHVIEEPLESNVYGTPRLEALYNRLEDLEKLLGGSAEMFWRGARPGYAAKADADSVVPDEAAEDMQEQFDEYEHKLRRFLTLQGVDLKSLSPQVASPKEHIDVQIMMISIVTGIPKRILTGSERGELASTQDEKVWNALIKDRMLTFAEPQILRPLINKLIECGVLKTEKTKYKLSWPKMSAMGEKEKAEVTKMRSQAIAEYLKVPGSDMLVPPEVWLRDEFGYNEQQIQDIMNLIGEIFKQEQGDDDIEEGEEGDSVDVQ